MSESSVEPSAPHSDNIAQETATNHEVHLQLTEDGRTIGTGLLSDSLTPEAARRVLGYAARKRRGSLGTYAERYGLDD